MASLTLRSKPNPLRVADADRFVASAEDGPTPDVGVPIAEPDATPPTPPPQGLSFAKAQRAVVQRRTKPARRRTTVYLDLDNASMLSARIDAEAAAGHRLELSDLINELLRR